MPGFPIAVVTRIADGESGTSSTMYPVIDCPGLSELTLANDLAGLDPVGLGNLVTRPHRV